MNSANGFDTTSPITTNLVHAPLRYTGAWWKSAPIADIPGHLGQDELNWLSQHLSEFTQAGCLGIVVRPSRLDILGQPQVLQDFINHTHECGLRIMVRVSGGSNFIDGAFAATPSPFRHCEQDSEHTLERATKALQLGADGIDLGMLVAPSTDPSHQSTTEQLDTLLRSLHRAIYEYRQGAIVGAFALAEHELYQHYLDNYLFHHLRDNQLLDVPWNAEQIREKIAQSLHSRDALDHICAWRTSSTFTDFPPAGTAANWYHEDSGQRRRALTMLSLALPGTVYFRGSRILDLPWLESDPFTQAMSAEQIKHYRTLMTLGSKMRTDRGMGTGFLAWAEGAPWANPDVLVQLSNRTMTVLNTSAETVTVPPNLKPLLSSQRLSLNPDDPQSHRISPGECAWFDAQ